MPVLHLQAEAVAELVLREVRRNADEPAPRELPGEERVDPHVGVVELRMEEEHEAEGERGEDDEHERAGDRASPRSRAPRACAAPARDEHGDQPRPPSVDAPHPSLAMRSAARMSHAHPATASAIERERVRGGGARRRPGEARRHEGDGRHSSSASRVAAEQIEAGRRAHALELHPVEREAQRPRIGGARVDRHAEGSAALQRGRSTSIVR